MDDLLTPESIDFLPQPSRWQIGSLKGAALDFDRSGDKGREAQSLIWNGRIDVEWSSLGERQKMSSVAIAVNDAKKGEKGKKNKER